MTDAAATPAGQPGTQIAPETAEDLASRAIRLEREVHFGEEHALRVTRDLHHDLVAEVRAAEKRARLAEREAKQARKDAAAARREAKQARAELAAVHESSTWKAGRAVVAVPARLRGLVRR